MAVANARIGGGILNQKIVNVVNMAAAANAKVANGAQRNAAAMSGMFGLDRMAVGNAAPGFPRLHVGFNHPSYAAGYGGLQQQHLQQQQSYNLMMSMEGYHHQPMATAAMMNNLRGPEQQHDGGSALAEATDGYIHRSAPTLATATIDYYYHPHPGSASYPASNCDMETMFNDENTKGSGEPELVLKSAHGEPWFVVLVTPYRIYILTC